MEPCVVFNSYCHRFYVISGLIGFWRIITGLVSQWEDENSLTCTPVVYETGHPQYAPLFFVFNSKKPHSYIIHLPKPHLNQ